MIAENTDRLRARISELENDLHNKNNNNNNAKSSGTSGGGGVSDGGESPPCVDESSEERAEVMHGLLKELRAELIHKEEVCNAYPCDSTPSPTLISSHLITSHLSLSTPHTHRTLCSTRYTLSIWHGTT